jgi:hypothetical protein
MGLKSDLGNLAKMKVPLLARNSSPVVQPSTSLSACGLFHGAVSIWTV